MLKWLPIASAPRDGTRLLLVTFSSDYETIGVGAWEWVEDKREGIPILGWAEYAGYVPEEPTHWCNLPEDPTE